MLKNPNKNWPIYLMGLFMLMITACSNPAIYSELKEMPSPWTSEDTLVFDFEITDTSGAYNIIFVLHHADDYPNANLWLFFRTTLPSGKLFIDTISCVLANREGKWYGEGSDPVKVDLYYRKAARFGQVGKYRLVMQHGMWDENLEGIKAVEMRIERYVPE